MAEAALFGLARKLVSTIGELESMKGHQRARLAKEYIKLKTSIRAIQAVLLDAEKQQESSAAVKCWIKQVGDVLHDAEDLLDEMSTDSELKQQMEESKIRDQVRDFLSPSSLFAYATKIRSRFRALNKSLDRISNDSKMFCFKESQAKGERAGEGAPCVEFNGVVGRKADKKVIVDFLLEDPTAGKKVIAIVGIGGMGKSALAQLVYNDELVRDNFKKRWWASISDVDGDMEILRRICKAIGVEKRHDLKDNGLEDCIKESVRNSGKYLLVIDGVRDDNHKKWSSRMDLLFNGSVGCRIIVTTRSSSAAKAMEAMETHMLCGLSDDESWKLFESMAFITEEKKGDRVWIDLGREIANKCSGVPLAIKRIAMLLHTKSKMEDWKSFMNEELSKVALSDNPILSVLKLSYDRLPSELKQCFAYCSLFPKDHVIPKHKLLYLWIAQGYVKPVSSKQTFEEAGDAYFKQLLSLHFFQKAEQDEVGEIEHYKMHDFIHDLAKLVAGDQTAILTEHTNHDQSARHVSVGYDIFKSADILQQLLSVDRLRSCIFMTTGSHRSPVVSHRLTKFRFLRALDLSELGIEDVPCCIGGFKHLRYLNFSRNPFDSLPNSISKLSNLLTLDISRCKKLDAWPKDFRRLVNLRHLDYSQCHGLKQMPDGFKELKFLQHLSGFKVGYKNSELELLSRMIPKGELKIEFALDSDDQECWQLPATVQVLKICSYPGDSLPSWNDDKATAIVRLELHYCERLKRLPALRVLTNLKTLVVNSVKELEYVEEEGDETTSFTSFPCLEKLSLIQLPGLKGWASRSDQLKGWNFPVLEELEIVDCPVWDLWGDGMDWDSFSSLRSLRIWPMPTSKGLPQSLEQREVRVVEGSPPRINEDKVTRLKPEDFPPKTQDKDTVHGLEHQRIVQKEKRNMIVNIKMPFMS